jgi:hypothetical protein
MTGNDVDRGRSRRTDAEDRDDLTQVEYLVVG